MLKKQQLINFINCCIVLCAVTMSGCINLAQVTEGKNPELFRSGQPSSTMLEDIIDGYDITVVINLRGESEKKWFIEEAAVCEEKGVEHINVRLSAWKIPPLKEFLKLIDAAERLKKEAETKKIRILGHCQGGADRTPFYLAVFLIVIHEYSVKKAMDEYKLLHGHMCLGDCDPENLLRAYTPHQKNMSLREWAIKHYNENGLKLE